MTHKSKSEPVLKENAMSLLVAALIPLALLSGFLPMAQLASGNEEAIITTQDTNQAIKRSLAVGDYENTVEKETPGNLLLAQINCTEPYISLGLLKYDDGYTLLTVSSADHHSAYFSSLPCRVHLTSHPDNVISAVLLEHSPCDGGVAVVLKDNTTDRWWDVCSIWRALDMDFRSTSGVVDVSVELRGVTSPCNFSINIRAVKKLGEGLELRYLSSTEGKN